MLYRRCKEDGCYYFIPVHDGTDYCQIHNKTPEDRNLESFSSLDKKNLEDNKSPFLTYCLLLIGAIFSTGEYLKLLITSNGKLIFLAITLISAIAAIYLIVRLHFSVNGHKEHSVPINDSKISGLDILLVSIITFFIGLSIVVWVVIKTNHMI